MTGRGRPLERPSRTLQAKGSGAADRHTYTYSWLDRSTLLLLLLSYATLIGAGPHVRAGLTRFIRHAISRRTAHSDNITP